LIDVGNVFNAESFMLSSLSL